MALDKAGSGDHLITGSRDTTCAIWKLGANVRCVDVEIFISCSCSGEVIMILKEVLL